MLRMTLYIALLTLLAICASWLFEHDGRLQLVWLGYRMNADVSAVVLVLSLVLLVMAFAVAGLVSLIRTPGRLFKRRDDRYERAVKLLSSGFTAIAAGDAKAAQNTASKVMKLIGDDVPVARLLAMESEKLSGNRLKADEHMQVLLASEGTELIALRAMITDAMKEERYAPALESAKKMFEKNPRAEGLAGLLLFLYKKQERYEDALLLVRKLSHLRYKTLVVRQNISLQRQRKLLYAALAQKQLRHGQAKLAFESAKHSLKEGAGFLPAVITYVQSAHELGHALRVSQMVEKAWPHTPHTVLAELYVKPIRDAKFTEEQRSKRRKKLIALNPKSEEAKRLQSGLPLPEGAWHCGDCARSTPEWHILCPSCQAENTMQWRVPVLAGSATA